MRIAVVAPTHVPAAVGGAERLVEGIIHQLNSTSDHSAELVTFPVVEDNLIDLMEAYQRFSDLDLSEFDLVISSKYPAWMVNHPNHVVYMMHPLRGLYDTYHLFGLPKELGLLPQPLRDLEKELHGNPSYPDAIFAHFNKAVEQLGRDHPAFAFPGPLAWQLVHALDAIALHPRRMFRHLAISATVAGRPDYFPRGVNVEVVIPPSHLASLEPRRFEGFFTASRLDAPKRLDLLIDAMEYVPPSLTLTIAGNGPERERLMARAGGNPAIVFAGHISDEQLLEAYANALAVPFIPLDEDLGLVTLEAQMSSKPVITCNDSGGSMELVQDGVTGLVVDPDPVALGKAMTRLFENPELARRMGKAAKQSAQRFTWESVTKTLLEDSGTYSAADDKSWAPSENAISEIPKQTIPKQTRADQRSRIVVLSTYPLDPPVGGGALRCRHLFAGIASTFDVEYLAISLPQTSIPRTEVVPHLGQTVLGATPREAALEAKLASMTPIPIGDVAVSLYGTECSHIIEAIQKATARAHLVILAHPYLLPLLRIARPDMPFVYDSHNAEYCLKAELLPDDHIGRQLKQVVYEIEQDAVRGAQAVSYCSDEDREKLEALGPTLADWIAIPNGADLSKIEFVSGIERSSRRDRWLDELHRLNPSITQRRVALFVGSYHPPNIEAAECIVQFASELDDVLFILAGGHSEAFKKWWLPKNVVLQGAVTDQELRTLLSVADVSLVPMMTGSGTNLKLAEAFAAGLPVVSTEIGARGYEVSHERELLIAAPELFTKAIQEVLDDPIAASQRAETAYQLVRSSFDWQVLAEKYRRFLSQVVERCS